ncbi:MAG: hypothetical protein KGH63_01820, partial [Candidatus Micrarchaeota archaeon]|nr:hypothetical protein [Candidatus Micrarchaeota archaeon]
MATLITAPQASAKLASLKKFLSAADPTQRAAAFERADLLVERIFNPSTPAYRLSMRQVDTAFDGLVNFTVQNEPGLVVRMGVGKAELQDALGAVLYSRGYRPEPKTAFEHRLIGSSEGAYLGDSRMPIALAQRLARLQEPERPAALPALCAEYGRARELEVFFDGYAYPFEFAQPSRELVAVSFEPLTPEGRAAREP